MVVKNICGATRYFSLGGRGVSLAANATVTIPDTDTVAIKQAQRYITAGVFSLVTGQAGQTAITLPNSPAYGAVKLTVTNVTAGDSVTIAGQAFEWRATVGAVTAGAIWAGAVGADASTSLTTLAAAINAVKTTLGVEADAPVLIGTTAFLPLRTLNGSTVATGKTLAKSGAQLSVLAANLVTGITGGVKRYAVVQRNPTAEEVTLGAMFVTFDFTPTKVNVQAIDTNKKLKVTDGSIQITGGTVVIDLAASLTTELIATDTVTVTAIA